MNKMSHLEEVSLEIDPDEGRDAQKKGKEKYKKGFSKKASLISNEEKKKIGQEVE